MGLRRLREASTLPVTGATAPPESSRLSVGEHLQELRHRLAVSLLAVAAAAVVSLAFADRLLAWLKRPAEPYLTRLAFFSPAEGLMAYLKVTLIAGLALAMPVVLYQMWAFVRPALSWKERASGIAFVWWGSLLFALGGAFAYTVCLPLFLKLLLTVGGGAFEPVISVNHYLSFVTGVIVLCGITCELPLVVVMLTRLGVVSPAWLRRMRPLAWLTMLILAAVLTPTTDAVSLMFVAIPMALLYEAGLVIARWFSRG
ncbi:MAG TPA: twin-arginine translocase subunit TatC [Candidatus Omnitrophica bacterium]|nr:twin-arginine translocase subunit TatC [Candidatus Omnitrophota bacterium]HBH96992.1 twin-arginine translocase subunit TatC [Candidatus Omnitrophota bacterium]